MKLISLKLGTLSIKLTIIQHNDDRQKIYDYRARHPWIVVFGHRPMYCSNKNADDCTNHQSLVRVGLPFLNWFGLEELFFKHKVDLQIWAHEHSYERMWPIYNFQVNIVYQVYFKKNIHLLHSLIN